MEKVMLFFASSLTDTNHGGYRDQELSLLAQRSKIYSCNVFQFGQFARKVNKFCIGIN